MLNKTLKLELNVRDKVTQLHIFRSLKPPPVYHLSTGPKRRTLILGKSLDVSHPRYRYPESELRCMSRPMIQHIRAQECLVRCLKRPVNKRLYTKPSMTWASMRTWPIYNTDDRSEHVLCRIIIHSPQLERS